MRLVDLAPEWWADFPERRGQGIAFRCPHCKERIAVAFASPLDGSSPSKLAKVLYGRRGDTFNDLTVSPRVYIPDHARIVIDRGDVEWSPVP